MFRLAAIVLGGLLLIGSLLPAAPNKAKVHGFALSGTVSSVEPASKTFRVKGRTGKETILSWTDATTITGGSLKPGETVTLRYLDKDRKHIATSIRIGSPRPQRPASAATMPPSDGRPTPAAND